MNAPHKSIDVKPIEPSEVLNDDLRRSFTNSKKIYVQGSRADIQVPMREIALTDRKSVV